DIPPGSLALAFADGTGAAEISPPSPNAQAFAQLIRSAEPAVGALLADWLNGVFAVDSLQPWLERRSALPPGCILVDKQGRCLTRNALISHLPDDRTHGVIERQREIDTLDARIA